MYNRQTVEGSGAGAGRAASRQFPKRLCFFGAPQDTYNLGVSALGLATLYGLAQTGIECSATLFDYGQGSGSLTVPIDCAEMSVSRCGARLTWRVYNPESLWNVRVCARLGGIANPAARLLRRADAVLDISGGDSFSDIYGRFRFASVYIPKLIALENRVPLILLPQTFGPFQTARARRIAQRIVRGAAAAWARDPYSFAVLQELLGPDYDSERHCLGVDVAFGLPAMQPPQETAEPILSWLADASSPIVGLNVSGLLMNRPEVATRQYGLCADYGSAVTGLAGRILKESDARVLLIPHVVTPPGHYESDIGACNAVAGALGYADGRLKACPTFYDPCHVKWVISQCDWFCGTRMHSTIAALSSGVPTAAIAYSPKTLGVFETCGQDPHVADPRRLDTQELMECLWTSWLGREKAKVSLRNALPAVLKTVRRQMLEIAAVFAPGSVPKDGSA